MQGVQLEYWDTRDHYLPYVVSQLECLGESGSKILLTHCLTHYYYDKCPSLNAYVGTKGPYI